MIKKKRFASFFLFFLIKYSHPHTYDTQVPNQQSYNQSLIVLWRGRCLTTELLVDWQKSYELEIKILCSFITAFSLINIFKNFQFVAWWLMKAGCAHVYITHGALKSQNSIKSSQLKDFDFSLSLSTQNLLHWP